MREQCFHQCFISVGIYSDKRKHLLDNFSFYHNDRICSDKCMVSLGSEIRRSLTAYSSRTKCNSMPVMKNNDFESRIVWLARRSSVFAGFLFTTFGFWAWRGVGFLVIIFIFPRFYNRLAKSERRGRARRWWRRWSGRRYCNISTFVFDSVATKWKITCTSMWHKRDKCSQRKEDAGA